MNTRSTRKHVQLLTRMMGMVSHIARSESWGEPYRLSQEEVAHRLSSSRTTIWRLIKAGELEAVRIGSRTFVSTTSINEFLARHTSARPEQGH